LLFEKKLVHGLVLIPHINRIENSILDLVLKKYKDQFWFPFKKINPSLDLVLIT